MDSPSRATDLRYLPMKLQLSKRGESELQWRFVAPKSTRDHDFEISAKNHKL